MGCKKRCSKRPFSVPNISSPVTITGVTGSSPVTIQTFCFDRKCYKPPSSIQIGIASVSGSGSGTISLVNNNTGVTLATATVTTGPSIVTLSLGCTCWPKCMNCYSITGTATFGFSYTVNSVTSPCC